MSDKELCKICERVDAAAWWSMLEAADPEYRKRYHIQNERSGDMVIGATGSFDIVALNRAVGVQIDHATSRKEVQRIVSVFEESGSNRYAIQLCPSASTPEVLDLLRSEGFSHFNNWTKLIRRADEPLQEDGARLHVERIDSSQAPVFADILCGAFGWPGLLKQWIGRMVGREGWTHYLAFDAEEPIATGAMFVQDRIAWLGFAATRADKRRLGAQSGLIYRRVADAAAMGCTHIVVETAEEKPERPNPSYHNLLRYGFTPAYQRPNYLRTRDHHS